MKVRLRIAIVIAFCILSVIAFPQSRKFESGKLPKIDLDKLPKGPTFKQKMDALQLEYTLTRQFIFRDSSECFKSIPLFARKLGCLGPELKAKDGEFVAYFYYDYLFVISKYDYVNPSFLWKDTNTYHLKVMKGNLCFLSTYFSPNDFRRISLEDIRKYVHYYPSNYARKAFNADTVISYPLSMRGNKLHEKFNHMDVLVLQRNNAGLLMLYCFYTDKGYARRDRYRRQLSHVLRFKEQIDEELFKRTVGKCDSNIIRK